MANLTVKMELTDELKEHIINAVEKAKRAVKRPTFRKVKKVCIHFGGRKNCPLFK